jgi:drug/metabolite transporter (DMT)-like permease
MKEGILAVVGLIFLTDVCDTIGQLFLKSSINRLHIQVNRLQKLIPFIGQLLITPRVWLGFVLSICSLGVWLIVLSRSDLNLAFSLDSMRYLLITFGSAFYLREKIAFLRWCGIACVVAGIMFVAAG